MTQMTLALVGMAVIVVVFGSLHLLLRRVPFDDTAPRERWPWPVWSWYPLVLGFGLLFAFAAQIYWLEREDGDGRAQEDSVLSDIQPVRGLDEATPTPTPEGTPR